jgi:ABC-2 type transport system ATP-binding protein
MVLVGADGAGKSSLLRLLAGLLAPARGRVERAVARGAVGYAGSRFDVYPDLTTEENLRFFARLRGVKADRVSEAIERMLTMTGLAEARERRAERLSGGMQKKLCLAVGLVHAPELLLLDEPTVGVDAASRRELWDIVSQANAGGTGVVYTSPSLEEAERARRLVLLRDGRARETDADALLREAAGWQAWIVPVAEPPAVRGRLAAAGLGPLAYLRDEGLVILAQDADQARARLVRVLPSAGAASARVRPLTVEDAFVVLAQRGRSGEPEDRS